MTDEDAKDVSSLQFERLTFFSDAVFAIAITLLVLDLRVPVRQGDTLDFAPLIPKLVGFCISFAVIGIYWNAHHRLFGSLVRENASLRLLNLVFLATIVFLPFPTSMMTEYPRSPATLIFYACSVTLVGIALLVLTFIARREPLMRAGETQGGTYRLLLLGLPAPLIFLASIPIASRWPTWTLLSWCAAWPVAALVDRLGKAMQRRMDALPAAPE